MAGVYTSKAGFSAHIFDFKIRTSQCNRQQMDAIPFYRWINLTRKRTKMSHSLTSDQRFPTANMMAQMNSSLHTPGQQILPMNPVTCHVYLTAVYVSADMKECLRLAERLADLSVTIFSSKKHAIESGLLVLHAVNDCLSPHFCLCDVPPTV